ncbi:MAG: T9SS type A sorting domain-containing protein [Bacteroidia bacterium]|nr:T9SS type A sorting domain-containing protein [Bacteroidia bacterium]
MKKTLGLLLFLLAGVLKLHAQARIAFGDGTKVQTLSKTVLRTEGIETELDVEVKNISPRDVRIRLEEIERTVSDSLYSFQVCLKSYDGDAACIPTPRGYVSEYKSIAPGALLEQFKVGLIHRQRSGSAVIRYRIVSESLEDTLTLTAQFTVENPTATLSTFSSPVYGIRAVGPNPAFETLSVEYALPPGVKNAVLEIYDLMGRAALKLPLSASETRIGLSVRHLNPGVYFLNLKADDKIIAVKRFSVGR